MTTTALIPCDDRCMFAKGDDCDCICQGKNHKIGFTAAGASLSPIIRTVAGRRINPQFKIHKEQELAEWFLFLHENCGWTKREIAKKSGVSQPTVRRYITRLLLAEELQAEAEEEHAA